MAKAFGQTAFCERGAKRPITISPAASVVVGAQAVGGAGVAVTITSRVTMRVTSMAGKGCPVTGTAGDGVGVLGASNALQLASKQPVPSHMASIAKEHKERKNIFIVGCAPMGNPD